MGIFGFTLLQCFLNVDVDYTNYILTYQDTRLTLQCYVFYLVQLSHIRGHIHGSLMVLYKTFAWEMLCVSRLTEISHFVDLKNTMSRGNAIFYKGIQQVTRRYGVVPCLLTRVKMKLQSVNSNSTAYVAMNKLTN